MRKMLNKKSGFTLIELMIVVAILGILAAIAIPAFVTYVRRSKTAEASLMLKSLFTGAATYYTNERSENSLGGAMLKHCTVAEANTGVDPTADKYTPAYSAMTVKSFEQLSFSPTNIYFKYSIKPTVAAGQCGNVKGTDEAPNPLYTFVANGDLDGDTVLSTFEMYAGSNVSNELFHAKAMYINEETE